MPHVDWTLAAYKHGLTYLKPIGCDSWKCDECRPKKAARAAAMVIQGEPTHLGTITANPKYDADPEYQADAIFSGLQQLCQAIRREPGGHRFAWWAVWEAQASGRPHLHVAFRNIPWTPRMFKAFLHKYTGAYMHKLQPVTHAGGAAAYLAKYLAKQPTKYGNHHYIAHSQNWLHTDTARERREALPPRLPWTLYRHSLWDIARMYAGTHSEHVSTDYNCLMFVPYCPGGP